MNESNIKQWLLYVKTGKNWYPRVWYVVENSISQIGNINLFTHPRHQQQAEAKELERRFDTNLVIGLRCTTHHRTTRT